MDNKKTFWLIVVMLCLLAGTFYLNNYLDIKIIPEVIYSGVFLTSSIFIFPEVDFEE